MLGTYYYHEIIRRTIVAFGTLFNNIHIQHKDNDGNVVDDIKVPLAYAPMQKFLAKIQQQADLSKPVAITLPRMSFEMTSLSYDPTRKTTATKTFKAVTGSGDVRQVYKSRYINLRMDPPKWCPVPWAKLSNHRKSHLS